MTVEIQDKISNLLKDLISIPSESKNSAECKRALEYCDALFSSSSYKIQKFEKNGVYCSVISKSQTMSFDIGFMGHLDVVPAKPKGFIPRIEDGRMYGRGTADMKGEVAAMLQLFLDKEDDPKFDNCALILTTDEEVGGNNGIRYLLEEKKLKLATLFNPDGGGEFNPCLGQKGILQIKLETKGSSAHSCRAWKGVSAIELLIKDLDFIRSSFDLATEDQPLKISMNVGEIHGGAAVNSVADSAFALVDFRLPSPFSTNEVLDKIKKTASNSEVKILLKGEPVAIAKDNPVLIKFREALSAHGFTDDSDWYDLSASDARWFAGDDTNIILMLPKCSAGHIDQEWVDLKSLSKIYDVLTSFVETY